MPSCGSQGAKQTIRDQTCHGEGKNRELVTDTTKGGTLG